jgi:hypothetical protein
LSHFGPISAPMLLYIYGLILSYDNTFKQSALSSLSFHFSMSKIRQPQRDRYDTVKDILSTVYGTQPLYRNSRNQTSICC